MSENMNTIEGTEELTMTHKANYRVEYWRENNMTEIQKDVYGEVFFAALARLRGRRRPFAIRDCEDRAIIRYARLITRRWIRVYCIS